MSDYGDLYDIDDGPHYRRGAGPEHRWRDSEIHTVLCLLCRGLHRTEGGIMTFAAHLNEALNPIGRRDADYTRDIDVEDVRDLLARIFCEKKAAVAFIERQRTTRITRSQWRAFARNLDFVGTLDEWEAGGRRRREQDRHALGRQRLMSLSNGTGAGAGAGAEDEEVDERQLGEAVPARKFAFFFGFYYYFLQRQ